MRIILFALVTCIAASPPVWSRPVSYPGGITTIVTNNGNEHSALIHYSPTAKYSIGLKSEYRRQNQYSVTSIQMNNLIKRWNKKNSQANLYIKSGIGYADRNSSQFKDQSSFAAFTGIAADWESRRWFSSYQNRYLEAGEVDDFFMQEARLGIAPYIADYGDLHTWLMLEVKHIPEGEDTFTLTPLIRFFKDVHLVEIGISNHRDALFNWIVRF